MEPPESPGIFSEADAASLRSHPAFTVPIAANADLAVIAVHFNPCGYNRQRANLLRFLDEMELQAVPVYMLELTWEGQTPVLPEDSPRVLQIRSGSSAAILWQKESLLNVIAHRLPEQFTKIAWVDADVIFLEPDWLPKASALLDETPIIQLFSSAILTDPNWLPTRMKASVGWADENNHPERTNWAQFHPGFAWASRRTLWTQCGGLWGCIIGCGDSVMALAAMGRLRHKHRQMQPFGSVLFAHAASWGAPVAKWSGGRIRALPGRILHLWHGSRQNRQYEAKLHWVADMNPETDLARDPETGILTWTPAALEGKPDMVAKVAGYFASRREDAGECGI